MVQNRGFRAKYSLNVMNTRLVEIMNLLSFNYRMNLGLYVEIF